jgi:deazaflavin-dependent oxidoreductase (nitroreductase family)
VTDLAELDFCYLVTTGRITGKPHEIEIWFALDDGIVYLLAGGGERSDWVRNIIARPTVTVRIGDVERTTRARVVEPGTDEDAVARRLLLEKYGPRDGSDLTEWGRASLPVAIDWSTERAEGPR